MKVGICLLITDHSFNPIPMVEKVEQLGFESLWAPEHQIIPIEFKTESYFKSGGYGGRDTGVPKVHKEENYHHIPDPFTFLGAAAGAAKKLVLGTGICLVPENNPIRLAKQVATIDRLSNGKFLMGIGAGWLRGESDIFKVDFPRRWSQTEEFVNAMKVLWQPEISEFHGKYVDFPPLLCSPKPVQKPHPPILIGGELEKAAQRILAFGDGWIPRVRTTSRYSDPDMLLGGRGHIEELYREQGRDFSSFTITAWDAKPDREQNRRYFDAGAERVVHILITRDEKSALEELEEMAGEVL